MRRCAASSDPRSTWSCARDDAEALGRSLELLARPIRVREQLFRTRGALLEQRELARDRSARPLSLLPQCDAADGGDDDSDEREREADEECGENHHRSLEALLEHPEHAADDLARQRPAARRLEEVADRVGSLACGRSSPLLALGRLRRRLDPGRGDRGASQASPARSGCRAVCRTSRTTGSRVATPATSSAGPMRESGGRIRVCTTGVGTPDSLRIVTAASPVPSWVRSSSRSYASDFGNVRTVARNAFASSGVNARSACCTRLPSWPSTSAGTSFGVWVTKKTPMPFERIRRTVCTVDSTNALLAPSKRRCASSRKKTSSRLVAVSDLGKLLEELRNEPHEHRRPELRLVLYSGELQTRDDAAPVRRRAQEVGDVELRLAEELGSPSRLESDERAQEDADRLGREAADALQLPRPPSESRNVSSARRSERSRSGRPFSSA